MPNKFLTSAEKFIAIAVRDKKLYGFRKIEKVDKNHAPTCPVLQARSYM